jgi:hypothetical protein
VECDCRLEMACRMKISCQFRDGWDDKKGCGNFQGVTRYKPLAPSKGLSLMDQNFHNLGGGNVKKKPLGGFGPLFRG